MTDNEEIPSIFTIPDGEVTVTFSIYELVTLGCAATLYPQVVDAGMIDDPGNEFFENFEKAMEKVDEVLQPLMPKAEEE